MPNDAFIVFTDDNIASTPTFAKALFKEMIKEKKNIPKTFFAQFTVNSAKDTELLKLAAEAGCKLAYLGVESIRPESLLSVNKRPNIPDKVYDLIKKGNMTLAKDLLKSYYSEIFSKFRNFGIHPFPSIIVGLKGDSVENINETVDFLIDEGVVFMTQWFYTPAIGSGEFKNFDAEDTVRYKRFGKYDGSRLVLNAEKTGGLIGKDIEKAFWSSYQNFYSPKNTFKRIFKNKTGFCNKINFIVFNLLYYRAVMQRMQPFSLAWRSRWS